MKQSEAFQLYLSRAALADSSAAIKSRAAGLFTELFGDMDVSDVTYGHAEDFQNWLGKSRSKQTVNIYVKNFKPFWSWMVKRGFIEQNPFDELKDFVIGEIRRPLFDSGEVERILKVANDNWRAMILLGLLSLRRSEVLNLTVKDIDFAKNYILITPKKDTTETWRWDIKNHNQAIVPLPAVITLPDYEVNLHNLLVRIIENLPAKQPYIFVKPAWYQKLMAMKPVPFELRNCPYGNFTREFLCVLKRAKVEHKRFHDLRGTFATNISKHLTLCEVQKLMRHSSVQITQKYIHTEEQKLIARTVEITSKMLCV